jgi:hypothetical protein
MEELLKKLLDHVDGIEGRGRYFISPNHGCLFLKLTLTITLSLFDIK